MRLVTASVGAFFLALLIGACEGNGDATATGTTTAGSGGDTNIVGMGGHGTNPNDTDGDGVPNGSDNCPNDDNPNQADWDQDGVGDPCDPDPPPDNCGVTEVLATRVAPNVLVVLDRSLSMQEQNKWDDATAALDLLSNDLAAQLRLGLALFAGDNDMCAPAKLVIAVGDHSAAEFQASYSGESPTGATPMRVALERVRTQGWVNDANDPDDAQRSKNVVLVTDGQPNCAVGHEDDYQYWDDAATLDEAVALSATGVSIYVIGFGSGVNADTLNQLAEDGGTDNPNDPANRYYQANNATELQDALLAIGSQVGSCTLSLNGAPPDPDRIYVLIDGTPLVRDSADGFAYDAGDNTIELQGAACDAVKQQPGPTVTVVFGCPGGTCVEAGLSCTTTADCCEGLTCEPFGDELLCTYVVR